MLALDWTTFLVPASSASDVPAVVAVIQNAQDVSATLSVAGVGGLSTPLVMPPHSIQTIRMDLSMFTEQK